MLTHHIYDSEGHLSVHVHTSLCSARTTHLFNPDLASLAGLAQSCALVECHCYDAAEAELFALHHVQL